MKTTNEIKDEVAKSHGYDSWEDLLDCVEVKITRRPVLIQLENEAMEAYAQQFREGEKVDGSLPCGCLKCYPNVFPNMRFNVCPICGNKRCPHASDHNYECTNSNDVGQTGSVY